MTSKIEKVRAKGGETCRSCEGHVEVQCWVAQPDPDRTWHWTCWLRLQREQAETQAELKRVQRLMAGTSQPRSIRAIPAGSPGQGKRA